MYEQLTDRSRMVMQLANQEAQRFNHEYVDGTHILLGLIKEGSGVAAVVLKNLGIDLRKVRLEVAKITQHGDPQQITCGCLPLTLTAKNVVADASAAAKELGNNYVGTEHLLLGVVRAKDGDAAKILAKLGVNDQVVNDIRFLLGFNDQESELMKTWNKVDQTFAAQQDHEQAMMYKNFMAENVNKAAKAGEDVRTAKLRKAACALFLHYTGGLSADEAIGNIMHVLK